MNISKISFAGMVIVMAMLCLSLFAERDKRMTGDTKITHRIDSLEKVIVAKPEADSLMIVIASESKYSEELNEMANSVETYVGAAEKNKCFESALAINSISLALNIMAKHHNDIARAAAYKAMKQSSKELDSLQKSIK